MSTDDSVTEDLIQTLEDGKDGYSKGADKLDELDETSLAATFREFAEQRTRFADELQSMAATYGDDVDRSGSVAAAVHRGWMTLKEALSSSDAKAILDVAKQGEDHAVGEFDKAVDQDISAGLREVVQRQATEITAARESIANLVASHS